MPQDGVQSQMGTEMQTEMQRTMQGPDPRMRDRGAGADPTYGPESILGPGAPTMAADGPYGVLGLPRTASWEEITRAHRMLVSRLHPDRYVGEEDAVRAAAELRVRDVNEAYATIRRHRSPRA